MAELMDLGGLPVIAGPPWPGVAYFCTTRLAGVSKAPWASLNLGTHVGDSPDDVACNRKRLRARLPAQPLWLNQVHGVDVFDADALDDAGGAGLAVAPRADAAVTTRSKQVLAVLTADCLPVLIGSLDARVLGLAHAGWRGLQAGVLDRCLMALREKHPAARRAGWRAWIGPGISAACFEVGPEVRAAFLQSCAQDAAFFQPSARAGRWQADLAGLAKARLRRLGVDRVDIAPFCTYTQDELLFSYRKAPVTGRQASLAWLREQA